MTQLAQRSDVSPGIKPGIEPGPARDPGPMREVVGGVDTHRDTHTAVVLDVTGGVVGVAEFPADPAGYRRLLDWMGGHGRVVRVGVEGTGCYGAGLTRALVAAGTEVVEIDRPNRAVRRSRGKSDPIDAENAARAVLHHTAGQAVGRPKDRDHEVEALRVLHLARRAAVAHRADAQRRIKALIVTAPDSLREQLRHLPIGRLIEVCAGLRPDHTRAGDPLTATKIALRSLATEHRHHTDQIAQLEPLIDNLTHQLNPALRAMPGVGADTAAQLLITAGQNSDRITTDAQLAMLTGVAPLPASSGRTHRHRLNRGGDRAANNAVWRIVITRLAHHQPTKTYLARRTTEGLSKPEIIRCLKRYVIREIHTALHHPHPA